MKRIVCLIAVAAFTFAQGAWAVSDAPRSLYELSEIAGHGSFPSRGGPVDE
jgi:hypothetical protein